MQSSQSSMYVRAGWCHAAAVLASLSVRRRDSPSTSRSPPSRPTARTGCSRCAPAPSEVQHAHRRPRHDQVLSGRRHGQRRAGAAQDPHRPAAGRRVHGRRARRALRRAEPLRHPVACSARSTRSMPCAPSSTPKLLAGLEQAGFVTLRVHRGRLREPAGQRADQQRRGHAAQEGLGAGRRSDQLHGDGGARAVAGRAARDRRADGAADGPHRHRVRVARRGARAAVAHEGRSTSRSCRSRIRWVSSRSRRDAFTPAQRRGPARSSARSWAATSGELDARRATTTRARPRCSQRSGLQTVTVNAADVEGWRSTIESFYPRLAHAAGDRRRHVRTTCSAMLAEYRRTHP